jgi:hypothetical protein
MKRASKRSLSGMTINSRHALDKFQQADEQE